jgi:thiol-disulfide isomerase/thioredoxin
MKPQQAGLVYAEWCGHCQSMKPEWDSFVSQHGGNYNGIEIKTHDESKKEHDFEAGGFPTFFSKTGGSVNTDHNVTRTKQGFENWFDSLSGGEMTGGKKKKKKAKSSKKKKTKSKSTKKSKSKTSKKKKTTKKKLFFGLF